MLSPSLSSSTRRRDSTRLPLENSSGKGEKVERTDRQVRKRERGWTTRLRGIDLQRVRKRRNMVRSRNCEVGFGV